MKFCKKKQVIIYIRANPEKRISKADIVLQLTTSEETRKQRLIKRHGPEQGLQMFPKTKEYSGQITISHTHLTCAEI